MNKLKLGLVAVLMFNLVGCAAISEKKALQIVNSNHVVIFKVTHAKSDATKSINYLVDSINSNDKFTTNGVQLLNSMGGRDNAIKNYYWNGGLVKYTYSKTAGAGVFLPKDIEVSNGDLIMGNYNATAGALKFIKIVARKGEDNKNCYWDGSGVICPQENWDYRKDLPEAYK